MLGSELGRGGLGVVLRAHDTREGRAVALKRLLPNIRAARPAIEAMFQREYYALRQFSHPAIVEVYDYGVDAVGPFYTMELLDGVDLRSVAPAPWRKACELLRDVARSLAVLHSRGVLHNDVSARNVHCTADGRAKLIDFGSMTSIGVTPELLVGTPPFLAPERVLRQPLDQRTDLYALGALGYWLLTARYAYPASTIPELRQLWRGRRPPPSTYAPDVPAALDALVQSLMSLDRQRRPVHAGEVIDRLTAIAQLDAAPDVATEKAYLQRPNLIERGDAVLRVQKCLNQARNRNGSVILIEGEPGMGRTRMLDELGLQAELAGALVLRVAGHKGMASFDLASSLAAQAQAHMPEVELDKARAEQATAAALQGEEWRTQMHATFTDLLRGLTRARTLVLAVDDAHAADEASLGVLVTLARAIANHRLVIALTTSAAARSALGVQLTQTATQIELKPLSLQGTEALYRCVFGHARHVSEVAAWAHSIAGGNPAHYMELARDLVERAVVQYVDGVWMLNSKLRGHALPSTIADAYAARIARLSAGALSLAQAMCAFDDSVSAQECRLLCETPDDALAYAAIDELAASEVLACAGTHYAFRQQGIQQAVERTISETRRRALHRRIGLALAESDPRSARDKLRVALHLLRGEDHARGIEWTFAGIASLRDMALELDPLCVDACELALAAAVNQRCAPHEILRLRLTLLGCAFIFDQRLLVHVPEAIEQLCSDVGLSRLADQDPALPLRDRVLKAMAEAGARRAVLAEHERGLPPGEAAVELNRALLTLQAIHVTRLDLAGVRKVTELLAPLAAISPVAEVFYDNALAAVEGLRGSDRGTQILESVLARADSLRTAGVSEARVRSHKSSLSFVLGLRYANIEPQRTRQFADDIDRLGEKRRASGAIQLRMLAEIMDGSTAELERRRRELENRLVTHSVHGSSGLHLQYFTRAYSLSLDLNELKHIVRELTDISSQRPRFLPLLHIAEGLVAFARSEHARALALFEQALSLAQVGEHSAWLQATDYRVQMLIRLRRIDEARAAAESALAESALHELGTGLQDMLTPSLALIELHAGETDRAAQRLDAAIAKALELRRPRLWLGMLYEARGRVALGAGTHDTFADATDQLLQLYGQTQNAALLAAHDRLIALSLGAPERRLMVRQSAPCAPTTIETVAAPSEAVEHRARRALTVLIEQTQAHAGFVFALKDGRPNLVATTGTEMPSSELEAEVLALLNASAGEQTCRLADIGVPGQRIYRTVELQGENEGGESGIGVIVLEVR